MSDPEPSRYIPEPLRRRVMVEAGHRCAVPTCRGTTALEVHHITDWSKVKEHTFDNLICLCAVDHHRATVGEIDRPAMRQYKANLAVLSNRYGDFERRVIEIFGRSGDLDTAVLDLPSGRDIDLWYLARDGLIRTVDSPAMKNAGVNVSFMGVPERIGYVLTEAGREFVRKWMDAESLE